jgi:tRNA(adenine34) deaminase
VTLSVYNDDHFMKEAYKQALYAKEEGEIPVGAVVVCDNRIIARSYNQTERLNDVTAHAEMLAMTSAFNTLGAKYLVNCSLYVTLEPCLMCAGASYWAQIAKLIYGASDPNRGYSRLQDKVLHPKTQVVKGIMEDECSSLLLNFFNDLRNK